MKWTPGARALYVVVLFLQGAGGGGAFEAPLGNGVQVLVQLGDWNYYDLLIDLQCLLLNAASSRALVIAMIPRCVSQGDQPCTY